jgi:hypothetical protein
LDVTTRVKRFVVPVMFRAGTKIDEALSVVTLVAARFDVPVTFMVVAKRLTAFITRALPLV